ncbi:putative Mtochondrial processing peptidase [Filobasidium floriforme]|uniref:putative Mtochondrial processing peptidase n=1 Tax=Filobasidium floriforme TaxID=5210 RepID=UPI001E8E116A|nr:putative Mtochondrial processing peptidase [Filobasidium floriforme]KAH8089319.1 putative Mtochondrial processing peptidase [Filobasidium floriforme]
MLPTRNANKGAMTALVKSAHSRIPRPAGAIQRLAMLNSTSKAKLSTNSFSSGPESRVTTLPNKIRVTTETTPGHFHALGVYIDAGSRYESPASSGVSHLMDRMAFKTTSEYTSSEMSNLIDSLGSNIHCSSSRETIMYQSTIFPSDLPQALKIMSSSILRPLLLPEELEAQKDAAAYEIREIWAKPDMILPEILHTVAFQGNTLGMPLLCPEDRLDLITEDTLRAYMSEWYRPERMVVAGVGMAHEELVRLTEQAFGSMDTTYPLVSSVSSSKTLHPSKTASQPAFSKSFATLQDGRADASGSQGLVNAKAQYTGGELYLNKPEDEFVHVYVAFEGLGIHDPDIYALATMQMLLGGGGSFSAGGPGKGMYSRLYTNVLNQYYRVDYCAGFHHCYADSGLFGIAASVQPDFAGSIGNVIGYQLDSLTRAMRGGVTPTELSRAKNQLKSSLVMALESRSVEVEDLGRQTQIHGKKVPVHEMCAKIDAVTLEDIHRTATRVLRPAERPTQALNYGLGSGEPTVVVQGPLDNLGNLDLMSTLRQWGLGKGGLAPKAWIR